MNYGFVASKIDGTEKEFKETEGIQIPEKYSYKKYLPEVLNQGNKPICVPCSLSAYINWDENLENETVRKDNNVNLSEIFKNRTEKTDDGMSFKDAFYYIRHHGVETDNGNYKIDKYAKVGSELALKQAIIINGPCVGGLPVYNSAIDEFWDKEKGDELLGGHAVSIVGYNNDGFIIRNSWGNTYGIDGYYVIPYEDFNKFIEIWTVL
jgi:hypothetical protein